MIANLGLQVVVNIYTTFLTLIIGTTEDPSDSALLKDPLIQLQVIAFLLAAISFLRHSFLYF